jgi:hypothetical protein
MEVYENIGIFISFWESLGLFLEMYLSKTCPLHVFQEKGGEGWNLLLYVPHNDPSSGTPPDQLFHL